MSSDSQETVSSRARRAQVRRGMARRRGGAWLFGLAGGAAGVALGFLMAKVWRDYDFMRRQMSSSQSRLSGLRSELDAQQRRLSVLSGPRGRDIVLREHGFIRPGERILLFPPDNAAR